MNIKNSLDGWVSPVELIYKNAQKTLLEQTDEHIMARVESELGVKVDRDELIKAMNYDREQYEKGFENGYNRRDEEIVRCEDCKYWVTTAGELIAPYCEKIGIKDDNGYRDFDDFCSYGERKK